MVTQAVIEGQPGMKQKNASTSSAHLPSLARTSWMVAVVALLLGMGALVLVAVLTQPVQRQQEKSAVEHRVQWIARWTQAYFQRLEVEARWFVERLGAGELVRYQTLEMPGGLIQIFPLGVKQQDNTLEPPVNFAALAQMEQAEASQSSTPLELHVVGKERYLALALPKWAEDHKTPQAMVRALFNLREVQKTLADLRQEGLQLALYQMQRNSAVLAVGAPPAGMEADGRVKVGSSTFVVDYWWSFSDDYLTQLQFPLSGALAFGFLLLPLTFLLLRRQKRHLEADFAALTQVAGALLNRRIARSPALYFHETHEWMKTLERHFDPSEAPPPPTLNLSSPTSPTSDHPEPRILTSAPKPEIVAKPAPPAPATPGIPSPEIFRAFDIRGLAGSQLNADLYQLLGRALGTLIQEQGQQVVFVARDARKTSLEYAQALIQGLKSTGREIIDLGLVPRPVLCFATRYLAGNCGVMVTAGHLGSEYNGLKIEIKGEPLIERDLAMLRERALAGNFAEGQGQLRQQDLIPDYVHSVRDDVSLARSLKVVVDYGNGGVSVIGAALFHALGCELIEINAELNGNFPSHLPDPSRTENLVTLQKAVVASAADLGLAFDSDGDRLGVVDSKGRYINSDRIMMLLAGDVLTRNPGADILYDVAGSRLLAPYVLQAGGRPAMWKSGQARMRKRLKETGAPLAMESTGHFLFAERWYGFDDALYAAARLLEVLALERRSSAEAFDSLPSQILTPIHVLPLQEGQATEFMRKMSALVAQMQGARIITLDGLRMEFDYGWSLVRPANSQSALYFRFEAANEAQLEKLQAPFRKMLHELLPQRKELPF